MGGWIGPISTAAILTVLAFTGPALGWPYLLSSSAPISPSGTVRGSILIEGDADFTAENGITGGSGTSADPFLISGWEIDSSSAIGINIRNTSAAFVISDVIVRNGGSLERFYGIHLFNASDARVESASLAGNSVGVSIEQSINVTVSDSILTRNTLGVSARDSRGVTVRNLSIEDGPVPIWDGVAGIYVRYVDDLDVFNVSISGMNDWGIDIIGLNRGIIENSNISRNTQGLYLEDAVHVWVRNNTLTNQGGPGIGPGLIGFLVGDLRIERNVIRDNGGAGIALQYAVDIVISSNLVANNSGGVWLWMADNATTVSNQILRDRYIALWLSDARNMTVRGTEIVEGSLYISTSNLDSLLSYDVGPDNVVNGAPLYFFKGCSGLRLDRVPVGEIVAIDCSNLSLTNLSIRSGDIAIYVARSANVTVASSTLSDHQILAARFEEVRGLSFVDNNLTRNGLGLDSFVVLRSERVELRGNRMTDSGTVRVDLGRDVLIEGNQIERTTGGLRLGYLQRVSVNDNTMADNWDGLWMDGITDAMVTSNNFTRNTLRVSYSSNVTIFQNRFVDSSGTSDLSTGVRWNEVYPVGGNFWSRYAGWDDCSGVNQDVCTGPDGFGDVPHALDGQNVDRYPIVEFSPPNQPPVASFTVSPDPLFAATPISFDASVSWDPEGWSLRYDWDFGDGEVATNAASTILHTYLSPGIYFVTLTVTDIRGGVGTVDAQVRVEALPVAAFSVAPGRPAVGETVTFDGSDSFDVDGTIVQYSWSFGDGGTGEGPVVTHVFSIPSSYQVSLTVTDNSGFVAERSMRVDVLARSGSENSGGTLGMVTLVGLGVAAAVALAVIAIAVRSRRTVTTERRIVRPMSPRPTVWSPGFAYRFCPRCGLVTATSDQNFCSRCGGSVRPPPAQPERGPPPS